MNRRNLFVLGLVLFAGCDGETTPTSEMDPQVPPTGAAQVQAWLDAGFYRDWRCEPAGHAARDPSPHGRNRICNNDAITAGSGAFPVGAAAVKELLGNGDAVIGYAVSRKDAAASEGASWYWYESMNGSVVADGAGTGGVPRDVCADCHSHAERDFVFTVVP